MLVPFRPDEGGWRDRSHAWTRRRSEITLRDVEIVEAGGGYAAAGDFAHARAINRAAGRAGGDVFVIRDADTAFDPHWVVSAARLVASGHSAWALPTSYKQLTQAATDRLLALPPFVPIDLNLEGEWTGERVSWAGLVVVSREAFELVGGYDERITGWGATDIVLAMKLLTLWGPVDRQLGSATHLWHPRGGLDAQPPAQGELVGRYRDACGYPDAMRALAAEELAWSSA